MKYSEAQTEAIQASFKKNLAIIATAGSGKTEILSRRACRYVTEHPRNEDKMLVLSFTVKSAKEISKRIEKHLGRKTSATATNLHAYGAQLLRKLIAKFPEEAIEVKRNFQIISAREQKKLLTSVCREAYSDIAEEDQEYLEDGSSVSELCIADSVEKLLNHLERPFDGLLDQNSTFIIKCREIADAYQAEKQSQNIADFSDLINLPIKLIERSKEVKKYISKTVRCVMVDEYQDINAAQHKFVTLLRNTGHATYVGDPNQNIFAFRGSCASHLKDFANDKKNTKASLLTNYRCNSLIVLQSRVILAKQDDDAYQIHSGRETEDRNKELVNVIESNSFEQEGEDIANGIAEAICSGLCPSEIAVLYRTNRQSYPIEQALAKKGIPYTVVGSSSFFDNQLIRTVLGYLKLAHNESNTCNLDAVCSTPPKGLGKKFVSSIKATIKKEGTSLMDVLGDRSEQGALILFSQIHNIKKELEENGIQAAVTYIIEKCGVKSHFLKDEGHSDQHLSNIDRLYNYLEKAEADNDLGALLESISLNASGAEQANGKPTVSLMTIHTSKGLEFDTVYLAGWAKRYLPHPSNKNVMEENRLAFVAQTRAKNNLFICLPGDPKQWSPLNAKLMPVAIKNLDWKYINVPS